MESFTLSDTTQDIGPAIVDTGCMSDCVSDCVSGCGFGGSIC